MNNKDIYFGIDGRKKDVWIGLNRATKEISISLERGGSSGFAKAVMDTTENWNNDLLYIPEKGLIVVYSDKGTIIRDGQTINVAGIKIGDGNSYLVDLPFIGDEWATIMEDHIRDTNIHVTLEEKTFWNNKLNINLIEENLILNRE